jgi:two-component system NtrC family response regulator
VRQSIGKIEMAHRGTLFLDEIGDLPHPLQVKLLRFLQDQVIERIGGRQGIQVDVRVVSATNRAVESEIETGRFRADLYYRLNSVTLRIPPLRAREGDAILLARYFLHRFNRELQRPVRGLSESAAAAIAAHDWPGNVRELENRMKRAVVMTETRLIEPADLELAAPESAHMGAAEEGEDLDLRAARLKAERNVIGRALSRASGNFSAAAQLLGISRTTLYGLLRTHGLDASLPEGAVQEATENQ